RSPRWDWGYRLRWSELCRKEDSRMPAHAPKAAIRRWVAAWNTQDLDAAEELLAPEFVRHDANLPDVVGPQAERQLIAANLAAFSDLHFEIEQLIAEGDLARLVPRRALWLVRCQRASAGRHGTWRGPPPRWWRRWGPC